jgi:hypothetical protein
MSRPCRPFRHLLAGGMLVSGTACSPSGKDSAGGSRASCVELQDSLPGAPDVPGLQQSLTAVQAELFPELSGVAVVLDPISSTTSFFAANVDLQTFDAEPRDRTYTVQYAEELFALAPPAAGVVAILAHELAHVRDYTGMDTDAFAAFALEYAGGDVAAYERSTDEAALEKGCGTGLIEYREWLYAAVDDETEAEKRRDYYTPEEIQAWLDAH